MHGLLSLIFSRQAGSVPRNALHGSRKEFLTASSTGCDQRKRLKNLATSSFHGSCVYACHVEVAGSSPVVPANLFNTFRILGFGFLASHE